MKKSIQILALAGVAMFASSCSKSVEDYANEFCECGKTHKEAGDGAFAHKECTAIMDEAKDKFKGDDDAEKKFKEIAGPCMEEVLGGGSHD